MPEVNLRYCLAARARAGGAKAAAAMVLTVSDLLSEELTSQDTCLPLEGLDGATEKSIHIALEAGTAS